MGIAKTTAVLIVAIIIAVAGIGIGAFLATLPPPVKIELSITYGEPWKELIDPAIDDFEKANPNVEVKRNLVPGGVNLDEKVTIDFASGLASDITMVDSFRIPEYVEAGYLRPLDDFLDKWPAWDQFYESMQEIVAVGDKHYAVMIDTDVRGLWYWKPTFEKAGLPLDWKPRTWEDVFQAALTIKERVPEVEAPFFLPTGTTWGEGTTMQGFYMVLLGADSPEGDRNRLRDWGAGKWIGKSPAILEALRFYKKVYVDLKLAPLADLNYVPAVWTNWREWFRGGKIGIALGGMWEWREFWPVAELPPEEERERLLGFVEMPGSGRPGAPSVVNISGGWAIAINADIDPEKVEVAWSFFETLFDRDRHVKWLAFTGKLSPRKDALEVPEYAENRFLKKATEMLAHSTFRDTFPGYSKVSALVQEITGEVSAGTLTPEQAMERFYGKLVEEFGMAMVTTKT